MGSDKISFSGWQEGRILLHGALRRYQELFGAAALRDQMFWRCLCCQVETQEQCPTAGGAWGWHSLGSPSTSQFPAWHKHSHQEWHQFCLSVCCSLWVNHNLCSIHRRKSFLVWENTQQARVWHCCYHTPAKMKETIIIVTQSLKPSLCIFHYDRDLHVHLQNWVKRVLKYCFCYFNCKYRKLFLSLPTQWHHFKRFFLHFCYTKKGGK